MNIDCSPECKKPPSSTCVKKGHIYKCPIHTDKYYMEGERCVSCKNAEAAAEKKKKEEEKKEKKDKQKKK